MPDRSGAALPRRSTTVVVALVCSVGLLLVASVRFARFDWTPLPLERGPVTVEREVSEDCTEFVRPYTTATGRTISPVTVDDQQYLSLVQYFSGVPREDLHVTCILSPWAERPVVPWLAAQLPFADEAVSLATVNLVMTLVALWAIVFTLRAQRVAPRVMLVVGALFAVSWNTLLFSSTLLVDAAVVALVALAWLLLAHRRPWWVAVLLLVSYPLKETTALLVLPVLAAWLWQEVRAGRWSRGRAAACLGAAVVTSAASVVVCSALLLDGEATWQLSPDPLLLINNVLSPVSLVTFLIGTVPLFGPALVVVLHRVRSDGWRTVALDPAVVGLAVTAALLVWVALAADMSARFAWAGSPFAASLAAVWFGSGRVGERLASIGRGSDPPASGRAVVESP